MALAARARLAHAPTGIEDLSRTGVLDVRGELDGLDAGDAEIVRLTPERALVLCPFEEAGPARPARRRGPAGGRRLRRLGGPRAQGEALLRRLTDLDLDALPAMGSIAHVQALVVRDEGETFRIYFAQEYGHSVAEAVLDAAEGIA